jgi:hypothetical protein
MRYQKGSFELSSAQDLPLLRQVLRSQFVTHDQMFEFMKLGCHEIRRQSFNWGIKRLVDHQMVLRHYTPAVASTYIYSIGTLGFLYLQGIGEYYAGTVCIPATRPADLNCFHSIELNGLHLALARQNLLDEWMPEIEIRSRSELSNQGYAKDYDAIVTLLLGPSRPRFALEYERSPKTSRQYDGIRKTTDRETQVDEILYLVANDHLQWFLMQCFAQTRRRLYIGRASEFLLKLLETPVVEAAAGRQTKFGETL